MSGLVVARAAIRVKVAEDDAGQQWQDGTEQGLPGKGGQASNAEGNHRQKMAALNGHHRVGARIARR